MSNNRSVDDVRKALAERGAKPEVQSDFHKWGAVPGEAITGRLIGTHDSQYGLIIKLEIGDGVVLPIGCSGTLKNFTFGPLVGHVISILFADLDHSYKPSPMRVFEVFTMPDGAKRGHYRPDQTGATPIGAGADAEADDDQSDLPF